MHTVWPVIEFDAQEFTVPGVGIKVGVMLLPSMFITETPCGLGALSQEPRGTYAVTQLPGQEGVNAWTSTDNELDGWQEP